jgi:predicted RNase H-like HicB family nuclease
LRESPPALRARPLRVPFPQACTAPAAAAAGGVVAHVPALPGCWSQGSSRDEAVENAKEAIEAWLEVEQDKADASDKGGPIEPVKV